MKMTFELDDRQVALAEQFIKQQEYAYLGAIGGHVTYQFNVTTVGTSARVIWCKGMPQEMELDLTDYSEW